MPTAIVIQSEAIWKYQQSLRPPWRFSYHSKSDGGIVPAEQSSMDSNAESECDKDSARYRECDEERQQRRAAVLNGQKAFHAGEYW